MMTRGRSVHYHNWGRYFTQSVYWLYPSTREKFSSLYHSFYKGLLQIAVKICPTKLSWIILLPTILENTIPISIWFHEIFPPKAMSWPFPTLLPEEVSLSFIWSCPFQPYPVIFVSVQMWIYVCIFLFCRQLS